MEVALPILQPVAGGATPDLLAIGHVTRDLQANGTFSLGGTVTFAALTAARLGLATAIVTSADPQTLLELPHSLPGIGLAARPATTPTTFVNLYANGSRTQYLRSRAEPLQLDDLPPAWLAAPIVLFGPLANEMTPAFVEGYPRRPATIVAATPQGWLRRWDADGRVWPAQWPDAEKLLSLLDVLVLSIDDVLAYIPAGADALDRLFRKWSGKAPLVIATAGKQGATLYQHGAFERFPAYPVAEVDPTGAGDVFAAAFLTYYYRHREAGEAVNFANCAASFAIEQPGSHGIPTLAMVEERLRRSKHK